MRKLRFAIGLGMTGFFLACHPRPVEDLALADLAFKAAQKAKADSLSPDTYRKAENFYLRAKKDFADGYFESAKKFANEARLASEQAEYQALLKQTQVKGREGEKKSDRPLDKEFKDSMPPPEERPEVR